MIGAEINRLHQGPHQKDLLASLPDEGLKKLNTERERERLSYNLLANDVCKRQVYRYFKGKSGIPIRRLVFLCEMLGIPLKLIEQEAIGIRTISPTSTFCRIRFPFEITPLHLRLVAHTLGDGSIKRVRARKPARYELSYAQVKSRSHYVKKLIAQLVGINDITSHGSDQRMF